MTPDLEDDLADFCEAHYGAPKRRVIEAALREFIDAGLMASHDLRTRFLAARDRRRAKNGHNIIPFERTAF